MKIYLLKQYKEYSPGELVDFGDREAEYLVKSNLGRIASGRDFLYKPDIAGSQSKAFNNSPSQK